MTNKGKCDIFVFADERGRVNSSLKGVLSLVDFDEILWNLQCHRLGYTKSGRYFRPRDGYKKRQDLIEKLIDEAEGKLAKGIQNDWDEPSNEVSDVLATLWKLPLYLFEDGEGNIGYLLGVSQYYLDNFDKLGIKYRKVQEK